MEKNQISNSKKTQVFESIGLTLDDYIEWCKKNNLDYKRYANRQLFFREYLESKKKK